MHAFVLGRGVAFRQQHSASSRPKLVASPPLNSSSESDSLTPLQRKLATLGKWLVLISLVSCALVVAIGLGRGYGTEIVEVGVSLAVSVIPEGLVTVVTLTMAVGVTRMAQRKAIVRNLPAVETLGSVTTIASDKTGTLTEGNKPGQKSHPFAKSIGAE
jgi:P-type E1-E2 ATPase